MDKKLRFIGELEDIIQRTVDLVILHSDMSPLLRREILFKGKPLFISNKQMYFEQQVYAVKLYDAIPFLTKYQDLSFTVKFGRLKDVTSDS